MSNDDRIHLHVYGIPNCDSCRHTLRWLDTRRVPHTFHDVRGEGLDEALLEAWLASDHGPYLINRRSATWRQLPEARKGLADSQPGALLSEFPTLLKRPVITDGQTILDVGFDPGNLEDYI